jgi:type I restriction enzyme M protein
VLFVDYIAEHLNPGGRAGIIVPEGIISTSSNAYKALRKMLVEDYLWAVVSLPAGVFQPYSGVKTSILLLDKRKSKESDSILFVKIENDGFDLGAQRRAIDKNDLPEALKILQSGDVENTEIAHWVEKSKVEESGDWNLSGGSYIDNNVVALSEFDTKSVGEILDIQSGYAFKSKMFNEDKGFPLIRIRNIKTGFTNTLYSGEFDDEYIVDNGDLLIGMDGEFNASIWQGGGALLNQRVCRLHSFNGCLKEYVYRMIQRKLKEIEDNTYAVTVKHISVKKIKEIQIPLPPLSVQEEIVAEIDGYQKIIDGARQVVENYKPTIKIDPEWEMVKLGEVGRVSMCKRIFKSQTSDSGDIPFYKIGTFGKIPNAYISRELYEDYKAKYHHPKKGDILFSTSGTIGRTVVFDGKPAYFQDSNIVWIDNNEKLVLNEYLHIIYQNIKWVTTKSVTIERLYNKFIENTEIPLPPLSIQQEIVAQIEAEKEMVAGNKKLIEIYEKRIKDKIGEVWGEE